MTRTTHYDDTLWEPRKGLQACQWRHGPWIYYHSLRIRQCSCCDATEPLWADFGLGGAEPPSRQA